VLVDPSRNNVRRLGFFKEVEIDDDIPAARPTVPSCASTSPSSPTGELSFGAGFSSTEAFLFDLGITQRNFRGRGPEPPRARLDRLAAPADRFRLHRAALSGP
jgi:outer membrane protein insertion porin family